MTLTMIDGMDAAERLGVPADPDEDVELCQARASFVAGGQPSRYLQQRRTSDTRVICVLCRAWGGQ